MSEHEFPSHEYAVLNAVEWMTGVTLNAEQVQTAMQTISWDQAESLCKIYAAAAAAIEETPWN